MEEGRKELISRQACQTLNGLCSGLSSEQRKLLDEIADEILSNISHYKRMANFGEPAKKLDEIFSKKTVLDSQVNQIIMKRALVAKLALHAPVLLKKMNLPASILASYPDVFGRLADFLKTVGNEPYDSNSDSFCKDVRIVLGLSISCGSRIVDMNSRVSLPSVILSAVRSKGIKGFLRYIRAGGPKPWFRGHVDSRYLAEFNERMTINFYHQVADLLERNKFVKGYVGTTWYFDPQLLKISPRLAYLQEGPREGGAFFLRHGSEQSDIAMAIKTSETRRRLYEVGKYIPVCYSMLWPRRELLSWAKNCRTSQHD